MSRAPAVEPVARPDSIEGSRPLRNFSIRPARYQLNPKTYFQNSGDKCGLPSWCFEFVIEGREFKFGNFP